MNHLRSNEKKWITISEYVDVETGEIITKSEYERMYYKIKSTNKYEENDKHRFRIYTHECRRNRQLKLL